MDLKFKFGSSQVLETSMEFFLFASSGTKQRSNSLLGPLISLTSFYLGVD